MITELIRDNRKIVDRIPRDDIDRIIELVKEHKVTFLLLCCPVKSNSSTISRCLF